MTNFIKNFWKDEEGATAIEYGLIAGLIAVAIIVAVGDIGKQLKAAFEYISEQLTAGGLGTDAVTPGGSGSGG